MSAPKYVLLACLLGSAFLGATAARPDWLRAVGVEVAKPTMGPTAEPWARLVSESPRECWVHERRFAAKAEVMHRLAAGELDLFSAAAWFRDLNREPPECPYLAYQRLPGSTDEEKLCREVIRWARDFLRSPAGTLASDLEAVLTFRLCKGGQIGLPERG